MNTFKKTLTIVSLLRFPFESLLESILNKTTSVGVGDGELHIRQDHLVFNLMIVDKIVDGGFFSNLFIGKQIGKDLQKVRFTTTEKA